MEQIENGKINQYTIDNWMFDFNNGASYSDLGALKSLCTFNILAKKALQQGERDKSWALVAKAYYFEAFAESVLFSETIKKEAETKHENRSNGGKGKSANYVQARKHLIELLKNPPEGGWVDNLKTRKLMEKLLDEFETKRMTNSETATATRLTKSNMPILLRGWFKEKEILAVYNANSKGAL
jgi:hypothetical protein